MILVDTQSIAWIEAIDEVKREMIEDLDLTTIADFGESVTFKVDSSRVDSFVFFGLEAKEMSYILRDSENNIIKQENIDLIKNNITSWYDYLRGEFIFLDRFFIKLPFNFTSSLEINISKIGGSVKVALFSLGINKYLGTTILPLIVGFEDLENFERDDNGEITNLGKVDIKDILNVNIAIEYSNIDLINTILKKATGKTNIFIADEFQTASFLFGTVRGFEAPQDDAKITECKIKIERV